MAAVDRAQTSAVVVTALADRLADLGIRVLVVDLTSSGVLTRGASSRRAGGRRRIRAQPVVFRPDGDPALASGPRRPRRHAAVRLDDAEALDGCWRAAEVVLALVEVDPGIDLDLLGTWVSQVVPLVSAGRASRELLMTVAVSSREPVW